MMARILFVPFMMLMSRLAALSQVNDVVASHTMSDNPCAEWERRIKNKSQKSPTTYQCENGDRIQLLVTNQRHAHNSMVALLKTNKAVWEGIYYSQSLYDYFYRGYDLSVQFSDPELLRFNSYYIYTSSKTREWKHYLRVGQVTYECKYES